MVVRHGRRRGRRLLGLIEFSDFGGPVLDVIGFFSNSNSMSNSALVELREENPKASQENPIRVLLRGSMSALSFPKLPGTGDCSDGYRCKSKRLVDGERRKIPIRILLERTERTLSLPSLS